MFDADDLSAALQQGDVSLDQATVIASAEASAPGAAAELVAVADKEAFHVLKDKARKTKLDAEQHRDLGNRQHAARSARSHSDDLGMVHINVALEPHVGTPIVARVEAEAARLARSARHKGSRSNATSPTRTPRFCPAPGRAGRGARSSSCW
jgi:hypothetical protein